ncbi:centlein isoform X9 [Aquila chrysaetos chrysaetos]|uniref:centlein isoform X9 n=1 Tax=Aquila chrysaetos chrysaetos TaxID=223781 RepID=UPI001176F089|nr:centlein isoform X9 [Aquila chrysaetos chrysaetos]
MASGRAEAAAPRVAELEEELRSLAEELSRCQADKEFVWSLWKHLQMSSPDLTQAVSLVVEREKQKAEVKDRRVLEILQAKDSKIETLEQTLTGQQQEINNLIQRKIAVDEENARLKNEFSNLNQKFKDKSQELKDTEECAQKKEEQNRLVIKNLEEENNGLNTCCADLLNDLEKLRKQEAQWKTEKSGNDVRIKNLETDLTEAREQMKELRSICSNLSSQVAVKQEELSQKDSDVIKAKKELQQLQNLYRQNIEHTAQQAELIKQLQALNTDTQKVLKDQEDAHTAETTSYQKLYNELTSCFETVKTSEIQLQRSCASLQDQLLGKDQKICQLQEQLQQARGALNAVHQNSSPKCEVQVFQQPSLSELECLITMQKSEIELLQEKLKKASLNIAEHNLYATDTLESSNIRTGRKHEEPPVKRSRSLSPKSSFRESEELRKLKIAERKIENLEKTLQLKTQETDELRAAHEQRKERLQMLQTNYRALKEQLKQWEEGDSRIESSKSRYRHADPRQLCQEDSDAVWNELAFFKREHKKLLIEKLNLEEELNQMKVHQSVEQLFKLAEDDAFEDSTQKRNMKEVSHQTLQKSHSQNKDLEKLHSKRRRISCLITSYPSILSKVNRTKRRNTVQKPGYSVTLLQERIKSLQQRIAVLQSEKKTAMSSVKGFKETNEKLTTQLHLADQRLQATKLTIEVLTSNLAKWQQEKEDLQGKLKLREHLSQTAGKSDAIPSPSKNTDLEMKQLQCKLKSSNNEITKQSATIKSLKKEVQEKEERIRALHAKISRLERDLNMKRHLVEDLKSRLKANQENEKTSNETLESLERKVKALAEDCSNKKTSIDSLKQRLNVATKEKSQYEQMYHKAKDDLEKKELKLTNLESKMIETECAMTELETTASQQLHGLAKQSGHALETLQKKLLLTNDKIEEFMTFVKALTRELQHSVQELRTKIKQAKKMGEVRACKKSLSQESVQLAASILNVSTTDLEEILEVEDDEETAKAKMEFEKDKEWLQYIQKLIEAQFPFASYLMDAILEKLNEKKKLVEEYSSLVKHTV